MGIKFNARTSAIELDSGTMTFQASTTADASLNVPHGVAPTTPDNGDVWTTTTGLYAEINGGTVGPFGAGGGTVTSTSVTTANGVSGVVATSTTTPAITLTLGAITPTSVNGITLTTAGAATNFLNETGAYSVPAGGSATALSTGTVTATTYGITSDGAADDVVLVEATTSVAGLLGADKWDEIVANTLKTSNATHTGQVTGSTALALDVSAVTAQPASGTIIGADTIIINDGGVLSEATMDQVSTFIGAGGIGGSITDNQIAVGATTADDIEGSSGLTYDGTQLNIISTNTAQLRASASAFDFDVNGHSSLRIEGMTEADSGLVMSDGAAVRWEDRAFANAVWLQNEGVGGGSGTLTFRTASTANMVFAGTGIQLNNSGLTNAVGLTQLGSPTRMNVSNAARLQGSLYMLESATADTDVASDGQLWTKTATPNELWFTTDDGDDIQITSGTALASGGSSAVTKVKTADESVTSSTTLQDDDHFTGWTLTAGQRYKMTGYWYVSGNSTGDMKMDAVFTQTPQNGRKTGFWTFIGDYDDASNNPIEQLMQMLFVSGTEFTIHWDMIFQANASTGGTLKIQWAQNTSDATATILREGSWMTLEEIP